MKRLVRWPLGKSRGSPVTLGASGAYTGDGAREMSCPDCLPTRRATRLWLGLVVAALLVFAYFEGPIDQTTFVGADASPQETPP